MSFFGTVLTAIVTLLHFYVFFQIDKLPVVQRSFSRQGMAATAVLTWLAYFTSRVFGGHEEFFSILLEYYAMHWMGAVFVLSACLFLTYLISGCGLLFQNHRTRIRVSGMLFGGMFVVFAHIQGLRPPVETEVDVAVHNLHQELEGISIAVLADIHAGEMGIGPKWLDARVGQVLALNPDMIVLVGDIFERASDPAAMIPVAGRLKAPMGVWAVRGNHDTQRPDRRDGAKEIYDGAGIVLLENEWVAVSRHLLIAGLEDLTTVKRRGGDAHSIIAATLQDMPEGTVILLSHTPWMIDDIAGHGVDLMISGHTHGGQIWPFTYVVRTRYPYVQGKFELENFTLFVSRGTGTWGPRMRLWPPGEITLIKLYGKRPLQVR